MAVSVGNQFLKWIEHGASLPECARHHAGRQETNNVAALAAAANLVKRRGNSRFAASPSCGSPGSASAR